tara:strand:+ start:98 stop:214 length:117 start_codon:yes stop_codon:yes gene_type:complete
MDRWSKIARMIGDLPIIVAVYFGSLILLCLVIVRIHIG